MEAGNGELGLDCADQVFSSSSWSPGSLLEVSERLHMGVRACVRVPGALEGGM